MHLLVTDRLECPRCGTGHGLILIADRLEDRRVYEGALGCSNCRDRYPVTRGCADLRPPPRAGDGSAPPPDDPEAGFRVGALLGIREGPGYALLAGRSAGVAGRLAAMVEGLEVMAVHPGAVGLPEEEGVSRMRVGERLPLQAGVLRGAVLEGGPDSPSLEEAHRTLVPGGRLVVLSPAEGTADRMRGLGLDLLLEAEAALVGVRK